MDKAILFDLDGTLIDSFDAIFESFARALAVLGYPAIARDDLHRLIGYTLEYQFSTLCGLDMALHRRQIDQLVNKYREFYSVVCVAGTHWLEGAKQALELASSAGYKVGIVTTKTSAFSRYILDHLGASSCIEVIIGREDVEHPKPSKEPIDKALNALKVVPLNAIMIGDSRLDMEAARNAGVKGYGVSCGFGSLEDLALGDMVFTSSLEAVEYIVNKD